jgi:sugar lactone lactonase YvrE
MPSNFVRSSLLGAPIVASILAAAAADAAAAPSFGEGTVLAPIGAEAQACAGQPGCNGGFPEGVLVLGNRVYVTGPANFGTAGKGPSVVTVLARSNGHLIDEIQIAGEATAFEHALSGIATDGSGDIFVLSTQLGVIRIERHGDTYVQSSYASPVPDIPTCPFGGFGCTPSFVDLPPLPNEMTFDDAGNLYITDSLQATIFKVAAGGGAPVPWFSSPAFVGSLLAPLPFGTNGIDLSPDGEALYVVETFDAANPSLSHVYRVPLAAPAAIPFATFDGGVVADSVAFGASGDLYVSLAGASQIAVLAPDGSEKARIGGPAGSAIPSDNPAGIAFDDARRSLLVANHAIFGDPAHFAVLRVFVDDRAAE